MSDPYRRTVPVPLASHDDVPAWLVPTQVTKLTVDASATDPFTFDLMPLDGPTTLDAPNNTDTEAITSGLTATAVHLAAEVGSTQSAAFPSPLGPVAADRQPTGSVTMQATVRARTFDADVTSSAGDPLLATVYAHPAASHPITIAPGGNATITFAPGGNTTITVHFTPAARSAARTAARCPSTSPSRSARRATRRSPRRSPRCRTPTRSARSWTARVQNNEGLVTTSSAFWNSFSVE